MFGLGTLTLPADFARLGWIVALLVMLLCLCGMLYCGRLFTLLAAKVISHIHDRHPHSLPPGCLLINAQGHHLSF